jgi:hypothetical protein
MASTIAAIRRFTFLSSMILNADRRRRSVVVGLWAGLSPV